MAVRNFTTSTSDEVILAPGALVGLTYGAFGYIARVSVVDTGMGVLVLTQTDGGGNAVNVGFSQFNQQASDFNGASQAMGSPAPGIGTEWWFILLRKGTGTVAPRVSFYNYTTSVWYHGAWTSTVADYTTSPITATSRVRQKSQFGAYPGGRLAATGVWKNAVPWATDAAVEAAGLHTSLNNWKAATPTALWGWNQASTATAVTDLMGGGANQVSITGTSVVTGDDPPGFSFAIVPTDDGYILQEDGFKILLEDGSGFLIGENFVPVVAGFAATRRVGKFQY
jgi:hypothetical protein